MYMSKKHKITLIVISSLFLLIIVGGIFLSKWSSKDTNDKVMVKNVPNLAKREELLNAMTHKEVIHYRCRE